VILCFGRASDLCYQQSTAQLTRDRTIPRLSIAARQCSLISASAGWSPNLRLSSRWRLLGHGIDAAQRAGGC